jgi:hypothetical protein
MARCAHHINALMAQYMGFLSILKILSVESALYELRGRFFIESRIQPMSFIVGSRVRRNQAETPTYILCVTLLVTSLVLDPDRRYIAPAGRTAVGGRLLVEVRTLLYGRGICGKGYKAAYTFRLSLIVYVETRYLSFNRRSATLHLKWGGCMMS